LFRVFLRDELVESRLNLFQNRIELSLRPILRVDVEFARWRWRLQRKEATEGRQAESRRKESERSSLAILEKELASAKIDVTAILPRPAQGDAPVVPHAEEKI
jgi:hypothetical protein